MYALGRPEESIITFGDGVTSNCELSDMCSKNQVQILYKTLIFPWAIFLTIPWNFYFLMLLLDNFKFSPLPPFLLSFHLQQLFLKYINFTVRIKTFFCDPFGSAKTICVAIATLESMDSSCLGNSSDNQRVEYHETKDLGTVMETILWRGSL